MAIACYRHRVAAKTGHHEVTLESTKLVLGSITDAYVDYFETCRHKRNVIDYMHSNAVSETEADEILEKAKEFYEVVETWIGSKFPDLLR